MDIDTFFSTPRWKILEILAQKPSSPLEISKQLNTSVSYVSQQLKLLEAGNFISKEKTGSAEKGKPRSVYSISNEMLHLTVLTREVSRKKLIFLTDHHKLILRIWLLENPSLHYYLEKFYWHIEQDLAEIYGIFAQEKDLSHSIIIVTESRKLKPKIEAFFRGLDFKFNFKILSSKEVEKISLENYHAIYDPSKIGNLKGGIKNEGDNN